MQNQKSIYIFLAVAALILMAIGVTFGLKGALYVDKKLIAKKELSDLASIKEDTKKIKDMVDKEAKSKVEAVDKGKDNVESRGSAGQGDRGGEKNVAGDKASGSEVKDDIESTGEILNCDVAVVGASAGGTAAAIASAREGAETCLIEETDSSGGMLTAAGVSAIDGRQDTPSGIFREIIDNIEKFYAADGRQNQIHNCNVSWLCFEPSVGDLIIKRMLSVESKLRVFYNSAVNKVYREGNQILGVSFVENGSKEYVVKAKVTVDATEFGDLMYLADVPYDLGIDKDSQELLSEKAEECIQPLTYVAILKKQAIPDILTPPPNYDRDNFKCVIKNPLCPDSKSLFDYNPITEKGRLIEYGRMPGGKVMINIPSHSWGNDFHATTPNLDNYSREEILEEAKNYSRGLIYFMQTELGMENYAIYDEFGTEDKFAKIPYVRESRRLQGVYRFTETDVNRESSGERSELLHDAIAIGDYPIDLHFCQYGIGDVYQPVVPYQIPYGVVVPREVNGFMVADKNISVSHIANGTTRLQPVTMAVGQAVGIAAAMAAEKDIEPREIDVAELQEKLLQAKSNLFYFRDLPASHFAYIQVARLAVKGYISGYADLTFKPNGFVNQADLYKIFRVFLVSRGQDESFMAGVGLNENSSAMVKRSEMASYLYNLLNDAGKIDVGMAKSLNFIDVKSGTNLYLKLSQLVGLGVISSESKLFRPNEILTRAEAMVMVGRAMDLL